MSGASRFDVRRACSRVRAAAIAATPGAVSVETCQAVVTDGRVCIEV